MQHPRTFALLLCASLVGCAGEEPPTIPEPETPDTPAPTGFRVSGRTMDYFVANSPLAGASVATDGITPQKTAQSGGDGAYALEDVPGNSVVFLSGSRQGFLPTRNPPVTVGTAAVTQDIYVMSAADVQRQYTTAGLTPPTGRGIIIAELLRNNGTALADLPLTSVQLVDAANAPVTGVVGPFVLGAAGDVVPTGVTATQLHNNKSRVAFLDVLPGTHQLKVTIPQGGGGTQTVTTNVTVAADSATLVVSRGASNGGGGTQGANTNPRFAADIYPRLQTAANGGVGCANCHTVGGTGALLVLNALAADVLATLKATPGLIDTANPAASLLLTKPLYEAPPAVPNHPNATFLDANDATYQLLLRWIQQGAEL